MLIIRPEQSKALEEAAREGLVDRMTARLRQKFGAHLAESDEALRRSVSAWDEDARHWGLHSPEVIGKYIESCAVIQRERPALETRLATYLQLYHEGLAARVDLDRFSKHVVNLAATYQIRDEEAVAWMAVILLAGRRLGLADDRWVHDTLGRPGLDDQARLRQLHDEAVKRGWTLEGRGS
jgi:hypothetical protein